MNDEPKYPHITVTLTEGNGNAFVILGKVTSAMKKAGISKEEVEAFRAEATAGDYDHLLCTCMNWVDVE